MSRRRYSISDARKRLPSLVREAEKGEAISLTRRGEPVAVLFSNENYSRLTTEKPQLSSAIAQFRKDYDLEELNIDRDLQGYSRPNSWTRRETVSLRYLLDTNVLSEPVKPRPNSTLVARLQKEQGRLATAAPVWNELVFGVTRLPPSARRHTLEAYIRGVLEPAIPILPYDARAAEWHALERARLASLGRTPAYVDGSIAAVAKTNQLILVTRNVSHYQGFRDLAIEDWIVSKTSGPSP